MEGLAAAGGSRGAAAAWRRGGVVLGVGGGGAEGGAADGAGGVLPEPGVDAGDVEGVAAGGEHAHHVLRLVLLQAHRAPARARQDYVSFTLPPDSKLSRHQKPYCLAFSIKKGYKLF